MVKKYVHYITNFKSQIDRTHPEIVFSGIPLAQENADFCKEENKFKGATEKSVEFNKLLEKHGLKLKDGNIIESFGKAAHGSNPHLGKNAFKPFVADFFH